MWRNCHLKTIDGRRVRISWTCYELGWVMRQKEPCIFTAISIFYAAMSYARAHTHTHTHTHTYTQGGKWGPWCSSYKMETTLHWLSFWFCWQQMNSRALYRLIALCYARFLRLIFQPDSSHILPVRVHWRPSHMDSLLYTGTWPTLEKPSHVITTVYECQVQYGLLESPPPTSSHDCPDFHLPL